MKLLVFAHIPPPHHGQSYMVKLMLDGFGGDRRREPPGGGPTDLSIECYHVNARFSKSLQDIGEFQGTKLFLILFYCAQAIWCRFRYGVENFYYVPAPGKKVALYRDWLVMLLCRPFFKRVILHWHAAGLAKWLETSAQMRTRAATYRLFQPVDLSIVLSQYNRADAEKLLSHKICVVNNGIVDPCPSFETDTSPRRAERFERRRRSFAGDADAGSVEVNVLFLAHCTREKGVFAAVESILLASRDLASRRLPVRLKLIVAGNFVTNAEHLEFEERLRDPEVLPLIEYVGFVSGERKNELLSNADLFLFPTCYHGENQPVNLIEAMAFGLPIVTTRWRSLPEMLPENYPGLVNGQNPDEIAPVLLKVLAERNGEMLRRHFTQQFTMSRHLASLAAAVGSLE
jgi:glycosyltransferase involved in cell wall biosynthesis